MGVVHGLLEFLLDDVLDFFVDGEDNVVAGVGLALDAAEPFAARVHGDQHLAGRAVQARVEGVLNAAQALVVQSDVADGLRGQFALGIETLRLLLKVDAAQVHGADPLAGFRVHLARDPGEGVRRLEPRHHLPRVAVQDARQQAGGVLRVGNFAGNGKHRVHRNGHGQLVAVAVVNDAAAGRHRNRALLLPLRALQPVAVTEDLQLNQAEADESTPQKQEAPEQVQPPLRVLQQAISRHGLHLTMIEGSKQEPELRYRNHRHVGARHHRHSGVLGAGLDADHLSGLRGLQAHLPRQHVNALRVP